jgi:hypothetical protein
VPVRLVREGILTSARMARLGWAEEVLFRRILSIVDDFGRYYGDPGMLRAACYPRQLAKVSDQDIAGWLQACVDAGLLVVYRADNGEPYIQVPRFGQQIRAKQSKFPDPAEPAEQPLATAKQLQTDVHLDVSEDVSVSEGVVEGVGDSAQARPSKPKPSRRCPENFAVTEELRAWAAKEVPAVDVDSETAKLRDHEYAKPRSDWSAAWRNWMRTAEKFAARGDPRQQGPPTTGPPPGKYDHVIAGLTRRNGSNPPPPPSRTFTDVETPDPPARYLPRPKDAG